MRRSKGKPPVPAPSRALLWTGTIASFVFVGIVAALIFRTPQERASSPGTNSVGTSNTSALDGIHFIGATNPATGPTNEAALMAAFDAMPDDEKVAALLSIGSESLGKGDNAAGLRHYQTALKIKPEDEDIHFNIGVALARLGQIEPAIASYQEALKIFPEYAEAHNNLGNLLANRGRLAEALTHLQTAVKVSPESASAHNNLGSVLARQGDLQKAMEHFEQASRLQPDYVEAQFNLASTYLELGRINLAIDKYSEILRNQPDFKPAQAGLQRARRRMAEAR